MGAVFGAGARLSRGAEGLVPAVGEYARNSAPKPTPGKHDGSSPAAAQGPAGTGTAALSREAEPEEGGCRPEVARALSSCSGMLFGVGKGGKRLYQK